MSFLGLPTRFSIPAKVKLRLCPSHIVLFQHGHMRQKSGIRKRFGARGAVPDAGVALDADAGRIRHILRIDGTHRAALHADAAVDAALPVGHGLGF